MSAIVMYYTPILSVVYYVLSRGYEKRHRQSLGANNGLKRTTVGRPAAYSSSLQNCTDLFLGTNY